MSKSKAKQKKQAAFVYISACCKVQATKDACERALEDKKSGDWSQSALGTWNCSKCNRKCKVSRTQAETK